MTAILSKAPAKLIISGEHSVLFNKKAITCAINLWTNVKISKTKAQSIIITEKRKKKVISLKTFSMEEENKNFILEIVRRFFVENKKPICGLKIDIKSQITMSSGLGSSASIIVAMVFGLNELLHTKKSKDDLIKLCISLEDICHGKSSGVDVITIVNGGVLLFDGKKTDKIAHSLDDIWLINTGKPHFSTKDVCEFVKKEFNTTALIWEDFSKTTDLVKFGIVEGSKYDKKLSIGVGQNEKLLESIGVVGKSVANFIKGLLPYNIYGKVCGAGTIGKKDEHCGFVAIFQRLSKQQVKVLKKICKKYKFKVKKTQLINSGVDVGYYI